jgi:CheY-like chemotaxis protein
MESPALAERPEVTNSLAGLNILVVEDDAFIALDCQEALLEAGAVSVEIAKSEVGVMRYLLSQTFHAAVIDVHLSGGESGFVVAQHVMQRRVPFVFCTGVSASSAIPLEFQHVAVVSKPYDMVELVRQIQIAVRSGSP